VILEYYDPYDGGRNVRQGGHTLKTARAEAKRLFEAYSWLPDVTLYEMSRTIKRPIKRGVKKS
jgi:hypothetical protein